MDYWIWAVAAGMDAGRPRRAPGKAPLTLLDQTKEP